MAKAKTIWQIAESVIEHTARMLLWGPPGTGKTYLAQSARSDKRPVYIWNLTDETPSAEGRGFYVPKGDKFEWQDGPVLKAWREGARLVLNEIQRASNDTLSFLLSVLDDSPSAAMTLPTGETIRPRPGFAVVATSNEEPAALPEALRDRFPVALEITEPHPAAILALPEDLRAIALITARADQQERISIRAWYEYAKLRESLSKEIALRAVFGDRHAEIAVALGITNV